MFSYLIPSSLHLDSLFPSWSFERLERARWLISCIILNNEEGEPVRLHSALLKQYLTSRHYTVIEDLCNAGVINVSDSYSSASHESKRYSLCRELFSNKLATAPILSTAIKRHIKTYNDKQAEITSENWTSTDSKILECLKVTTMELQAAREYADLNYTNCKLARAINSIASFETGDFRVFKPEQNGRLYYVLTSMPKELRRFLRYMGKPLWEADLKCFWPSCLVRLAKGRERHRLEMLVETRGFYEFVAALIDKEMTRDDVKKTFMRNVLFIRNSGMPDLKRRFIDTFPQLMWELYNIKRDGVDKLESYFSQLEASIVFPIIDTLPFAMSIHDSIVTTEDNIEAAKIRLENRASDILGINARVAKKLLGEEEAAFLK